MKAVAIGCVLFDHKEQAVLAYIHPSSCNTTTFLNLPFRFVIEIS